jgi:hypothetical protein
MPAVTEHYAREAVRFAFAEAQMVSITLDNGRNSEPQQISACLLNLSPQGAKLAVPTQLPPGKTFRLRLTVPQLAMDFFVAAKVCWAATEGESGSVIGCQFNPGIPAGFLGSLASEGNLDRRGSSRESTHCKLLIIPDGANAAAKEKVILQNYSVGGFCIEAWRPISLGEKFRIVSDRTDATVEAVVHWQIKHSGVFTLGCGYLNEGGGDRLEQILASA